MRHCAELPSPVQYLTGVAMKLTESRGKESLLLGAIKMWELE